MRANLTLYDTMSGRKEVFRPRSPPHVSMFVCGPTVQSRMHLGHARTYIFYDALARYLQHLHYDVFFLMNITDIDETITRAAGKVRDAPLEYSARMSATFLADMEALKINEVDRFEPVSPHVDEMIRQASALVSKGFAYEAGGWVYFDTTRFPRWGRLSHQSKRDLSLRPLELSPEKKNLNDFALWRPETLIEGRWESPWGLGSPGWHIQDTAVTIPMLGAQYDIHGGAFELVYPHHEAEIAQGESLTGARPLVRHWVHTNLLNMEGQKMSKSLGNVVTVRDALRSCSADLLRFYFLSTHYRKEADLSGVGEARARLSRIRSAAMQFRPQEGDDGVPIPAFEQILNDDFDAPRVIDWAERTLRTAVRTGDRDKARGLALPAIRAMKILGVDMHEDT